MDVSRYFEGVAWKHLSAVDAERKASNQHEFGGLKAAGFHRYLGEPSGGEKMPFDAEFIWLDEDEAKSIVETGKLTWYDTRYDDPNRGAELRLYYTGNAVSETFKEGDFCLFAKRKSGKILVVACTAGSTVENQLRWLFDLAEIDSKFQSKDASRIDQKRNLPASWVLELLGVEVEVAGWDGYLGKILDEFGTNFPPTRLFSTFARHCAGLDPREVGYDESLLKWLEAEEGLFRVLEKHLVQSWLDEGFENVDEFIARSLSVQNRRKSRAGHSLENHLEVLFKQAGLKFSRGAITENRSKPDFLFPGAAEYHDPAFPEGNLRMLGAKSTCKDRWRQVLAEAKRVEAKHLITLEPGISRNQTEEMAESSLQLVVPVGLHSTYHETQQTWLMSLADFIAEVDGLKA